MIAGLTLPNWADFVLMSLLPLFLVYLYIDSKIARRREKKRERER